MGKHKLCRLAVDHRLRVTVHLSTVLTAAIFLDAILEATMRT